jgi:hypothetical protein
MQLETDDSAFHAADAVARDHVSGDSNRKEIAEPLIEQQLQRNPRITTRQDRRKRPLPSGQSLQPGLGHVRVDRLALNKPLVAIHEFLQCLFCRELLRFIFPGRVSEAHVRRGQSGADRRAGQNEVPSFHLSVHRCGSFETVSAS